MNESSLAAPAHFTRTGASSARGQVLLFTRGSASFAADVAGVHQIRQCGRLRPVVLGIPSLAGFVALGDRALPVFEPLVFVGQPAPEPPAAPTLCLCGRDGHGDFGLIVDRIDGYVRVDGAPAETRPPGAFQFILGQREFRHGQPAFVLDLDRLRSLLDPPAANIARPAA